MECTSCPGKDRELLVIVVGALFVLGKMYCGRLVVLIFSLQFRFGRKILWVLIVADGFRDMFINSVL